MHARLRPLLLALLASGCTDACHGTERTVAPYQGKAKAARPADGAPARSERPAPTRGPKPDAPQGAPNVVVVVWHAARFDRTSLADPALHTTPRLAQLGDAGVVFTQAVAPATWSLPATASLLTGLPVALHGVASPGDRLDDRFTTLAEVFADRGWDTFAWSDNPWVSTESNLLQGFDLAGQPWARPWQSKAENLVANAGGDPLSARRGAQESRWSLKDTSSLGARVFEAWLDDRSERGVTRPFLAFLDLAEAHAPRNPPVANLQQVLGTDVVGDAGQLVFSPLDQLRWMTGLAQPAAGEAHDVAVRYDATLAWLDDLTMAFLGPARAALLENAVIVVVGDHGEHLGEDGRWGHPFSASPAVSHVPLVLMRPYELEAERVDAPVSTTRVFPLLAELAGITLPAELARPLDRRFDRHGVVTENPPPSPKMIEQLTNMAPDADLGALLTAPTAALQTRTHRLLVGPGDHYEVRTVDGDARVDDPDVRADLIARWTAWNDELAARRPGSPRALPPDTDAPAAAPDVPPADAPSP